MNNIHKLFFTHFESNVVNVWQYDKGQILEFDETFKNGTEVQFEDGAVKVIFNNRILIPDLALEKAGMLNGWIQLINADNETTIYHLSINVKPRAKKNDYVEPEDEQSFREEVQQMIEEAGRPTPEEIDPIVRDYLEKNPPAPYDDSEIKREIKAVADSIPTVPTKVSAFQNDANYLTEHQSLTDYAKKTDIPSVPTKTSQLQNDSGFLTEHQPLKTINGQSVVGSGNIEIQGGGTADSIDWSKVENKPETYPPSVHNHDDRYYTESEIDGKFNGVNTSLSELERGLPTKITTEVDTYWNAHKSELKGDKGDKGDDGHTPQKGIDYFDGKDGKNYVITDSDYDAIADVVLSKLPSAESEEF